MFSDKDKLRILSYFEHKNRPSIIAPEIDALKSDFMEFHGQFELIDKRNHLLEAENAALKEENERLKAIYNRKPVAWANWKCGTDSYVPYRTESEAEKSVKQSSISATQDGPYRVVPLIPIVE